MQKTRISGSYAVFVLLCMVPSIIAIATYLRKKESMFVRYILGVGFALRYTYVMFTTSTDTTAAKFEKIHKSTQGIVAQVSGLKETVEVCNANMESIAYVAVIMDNLEKDAKKLQSE